MIKRRLERKTNNALEKSASVAILGPRQIGTFTPNHIKSYFYRTSGGAEIDLILEFDLNELWAIEIKRSSAPKPSKGFHSACDDLNPKEKFIVYSGSDTFTIKNDITIISLHDIMERLVKL
ncbi:hypothetical protein [Mariniflexile sp. HMF6888]|uniref:hypothetical protein n=1 Tax=Mariniflexile sp. HMF6888 TaxID=3373086 RepID=UPI00378956C2